MKITKLTIKDYGRIENLTYNFDKVSIIETPFIKELCCAVSEIFYSDYLRLNLPKIETNGKSVIMGEILLSGKKITAKVSFEGGVAVKKYYINNEEIENADEEFSFSNNSFEQEMTSLFFNKYRFRNCNSLLSFIDYKNYFAFYKGSKDKILPSSEFSYLYGEKFFRSLLNNYIRNFKPIWINRNKNICLRLLNSGEFVPYKIIREKEEIYSLSETEQTVFNFIVFLEIGRFWGELNRIKDLNWESKPLIALDLMERLDLSFDALEYIKNLKQNRQIIILKEKING